MRIVARVLAVLVVQGLQYRPNQVVSFPENLAKPLVEDGSIDASPDAVDYCKSQGAEVLTHEDQAVAARQAEIAAVKKQLEALEKDFNAETDAAKRAALGKQGEALLAQLKALDEYELAELQK